MIGECIGQDSKVNTFSFHMQIEYLNKKLLRHSRNKTACFILRLSEMEDGYEKLNSVVCCKKS